MSWWRFLLFPFALLYGLVVGMRNLLFDWGILPSRRFSVPVIAIGNLSSGGTGKTPHVEYLAGKFCKTHRVAILSRGYKRRTRGFRWVETTSRVEETGDEPLQMKKKFPGTYVAVHERRSRGIRIMLQQQPDIDLVILDDAYQHRWVKPGLNLLLTEYYKPFFSNYLLPVGSLREPGRRVQRADVLIVTKTPPVFSPLDRRFFMQKLKKYRPRKVLFSSLHYHRLRPLHPDGPPLPGGKIKTIFLLTGIANASALEEHLKKECSELIVFPFPDHHQFTPADLEGLKTRFQESISQTKIIVTTEKDAMRLQQSELLECTHSLPLFFLPIEVFFHPPDLRYFDQLLHRFLTASGTLGHQARVPR